MIYIYLSIYVLLLCFTRFSGVCHSAYMPIFRLLENQNFFPNDIYVRGTLIASTTYLYTLLRIFGSLAANTYFIFFLYTIINLVHAYFIFKIAELFFAELKKYNVGLILLLLFLYDYPIFSCESQLVSQHTFSQTIVAMPLLAAGFYYFFKDRLLLSIFLVAVLAIPLHLKSSWFVLLVPTAYLLINYRKYNLKRIAAMVCLLILGGIIIYSYRSKSMSAAPLDFIKRLELCNVAITRGAEEDSVLLNSWQYFLKFFLIFFGGMYCVRFVKNIELRRKIYFMYLASLSVLIFGAFYVSFFYKVIPLPEVCLLAFPRSSAYPVIVSILIIGGALLMRAETGSKGAFARYASISGLFALAFFPNFKPSIIIYVVCIAISYLIAYKNKKISQIMRLTPLAAWFFVAVILFLFAKVGQVTIRSYKQKSPFFPLVIFGLQRESYDCQIWAKENTPKESVFVFFDEANGRLVYNAGFRGFSGRSMLFGDCNSFHLNYDLLKEHYKREDFINSLIRFIKQGNSRGIKKSISASGWRLDYIIVPKQYMLDFMLVYSNSKYNCYLINKKTGN